MKPLISILIFWALMSSVIAQDCYKSSFDIYSELKLKAGYNPLGEYNVSTLPGNSLNEKADQVIEKVNLSIRDKNVNYVRTYSAKRGCFYRVEAQLFIKGIPVKGTSLNVYFTSKGELNGIYLPYSNEKLLELVTKVEKKSAALVRPIGQLELDNLDQYEIVLAQEETNTNNFSFNIAKISDSSPRKLEAINQDELVIASSASGNGSIFIRNPDNILCVSNPSEVSTSVHGLYCNNNELSHDNVSWVGGTLYADIHGDYNYDCNLNSSDYTNYQALLAYYYLADLSTYIPSKIQGLGPNFGIDFEVNVSNCGLGYCTTDQNYLEFGAFAGLGVAQDNDMLAHGALAWALDQYIGDGNNVLIEHNEIRAGSLDYFAYSYSRERFGDLNSLVLENIEFLPRDLNNNKSFPGDADEELWSGTFYEIAKDVNNGGIGFEKGNSLFYNVLVNLDDVLQYEDAPMLLYSTAIEMYEQDLQVPASDLESGSLDDFSYTDICVILDILAERFPLMYFADPGANLWIRDDIDDISNEPNTQSQSFYSSDFIWNRTYAPGQYGHQEPFYADGTTGVPPELGSPPPDIEPQPNYMSVYVINRSCVPIQDIAGSITLAQTVASGFPSWPDDFNGVNVTGSNQPLGQILGEPIEFSDIGAYESYYGGFLNKFTFEYIPFHPWDYSDYGVVDFINLGFHMSTSVRAVIDSPDDDFFDLTYEPNDNNNIAQRNMTTLYYIPPNPPGGGSGGGPPDPPTEDPRTIYIFTAVDEDGNPTDNDFPPDGPTIVPNTIEINFVPDSSNDGNDIFSDPSTIGYDEDENGNSITPDGNVIFDGNDQETIAPETVEEILNNNEVTVTIGEELMQAWQNSGSQGTDVEIVDEVTVKVKGNNFTLSNVPLVSGVKYPIIIHFKNLTSNLTAYTCQIQQYHEDNPCHIGGFQYAIKPLSKVDSRERKEDIQSIDFAVMPNPASNLISLIGIDVNQLKDIRIVSLDGSFRSQPQFIKDTYQIDISDLHFGTYLVQVRYINGTQEAIKFVKY